LLNWIESGEKAIFGLDLIDEAKVTIHRIQENLKVVRSRQESYANKRHRPLEFKVGDHVYLKVLPMKGMERFGMKANIAPCYIEPFPILEKCGPVVYNLKLPPSLAGVPDIFNVSQLKKCLKAPIDVVLPEVLDQKDRVTRRKAIKFFKVQWSNHSEEEAMWESEDFLRFRHPEFELP
jgi:hypothetical protein